MDVHEQSDQVNYDDSEWEYEYHETETETFYVTLDISSESATVKPKKKAKTSKPSAEPAPKTPDPFLKYCPPDGFRNRAQAPSRTSWVKGNAYTKSNVQAPGAEAVIAVSQSAGDIEATTKTATAVSNVTTTFQRKDDPTFATTHPTSETESTSITEQSTNYVTKFPTILQGTGMNPTLEEATYGIGDNIDESTWRTINKSDDQSSSILEPEEHIQILDFHTIKPLISFQKQLYSCTWSTTIGTDLLLTSPSLTFSNSLLKQTPSFDILAASGIKLIGQPVRPLPRQEEQFNNEKHDRVLPMSLPNKSAEHEEATNKLKSVTIPIDASSSVSRQNQGRFLERLIAIKTAKGERDSVTVYAQKILTGTGWRAKQRADHEAFPSDEGEPSNDGQNRPAFQVTPRGSMRTQARKGRGRGPRKMRGKSGLFRDYKPRSWDGVGQGIMQENSSTPRSWDETPADRENVLSPAHGSPDAAMDVQMMESIIPSAYGMPTSLSSESPTLQNYHPHIIGDLSPFPPSDQDSRIHSPATVVVRELPQARDFDVEVEGAPS